MTARELTDLVQKKPAVVCEADLSGSRQSAAAADQPGARDRMVGARKGGRVAVGGLSRRAPRSEYGAATSSDSSLSRSGSSEQKA